MWNKLIILLVTASVVCDDRQGAVDFIEKAITRGKTGKGVRFSRTQVLEDYFNVYDSTFLAFVWPKLRNGVHLTLGPACWEHVGLLYRQLLEGRPWAYHVVDASGRYQSGVFEGNRFWIGSKRQCTHLDKKFAIWDAGNVSLDEYLSKTNPRTYTRRERYFDGSPEGEWHSLAQQDQSSSSQMSADNTPPYALSFHSVQMILNITKPVLAKSYDVTLGLCLPRTCLTDDIHAMLNFSIMVNDHLRTNTTVPRTVQIQTMRTLDQSYDIYSDAIAVVLMIFTLSLLVVTLLATALDFKILRFKPRNCRSMSFDIQKVDTDPAAKDIEKPNNDVAIHKRNTPDVVYPKKEMNLVDMETLTINNMNNSNNINLVTVKKIMKANTKPPSITLDVIAVDETQAESCTRCGKYRKQCVNPRRLANLPACPRMQYNSFASLSTDHKTPTKRAEMLKSILMCFSLRYSLRRLTNTNLTNRDLSIVHALKVLATFWVIFVHVTLVVFHISENGGDINNHNSASNVLATGSLAFDSLLFVSGTLSAHHYFYLKRRYSLRELVSFDGKLGHVLQLVCFITNRAVRLLPPYAYAVFLAGAVSRASRRLAPLNVPDPDHATCGAHWWRNLLYINNFYPAAERCLQVSWYLSLETQLHALGTLLLCVTWGGGGAGAGAALLAMATATADVITAWRDRHLAYSDVYGAYVLLIDRPWARFTPYFVGIFTGWLVHKLDGRLPVSKVKRVCLWLASLWALPSLLLRPWLAPSLPSLAGAAGAHVILAALAHVLWPLALAWPALVLATRCSGVSRRLLDGGWLAALSRLSYSTLLLHGISARFLLLSMGTALSMDPASLWCYFAGTTLVSLLAALLLSLLLETPFCSLLRRITDCAHTS